MISRRKINSIKLFMLAGAVLILTMSLQHSIVQFVVGLTAAAIVILLGIVNLHR